MSTRRQDRIGAQRTEFEKNKKIIMETQDICYICGEPVDTHMKYDPRNPLSPTVDHIVPVSKGGHPSDMNNLMLCHLGCNLKKGDRLAGSEHKKAQRKTVPNDILPLSFDWKSYKAAEDY